jgi:hypothetical protein
MQHSNYVGQALLDLEHWNKVYAGKGWIYTLLINKFIIKLLRQSQKFVLPVNGRILPIEEFSEELVPLLHLPFDVVSSSQEIDCNTLLPGNIDITKTIALAARSEIWREFLVSNKVPVEFFPFIQNEEEGMVIWPIFPSEGIPWTAGYSGAFIANNPKVINKGLQVQTCLNGEYGLEISLISLREGHNPHDSAAQDYAAEIECITGLCCAMNCSNVVTDTAKVRTIKPYEKRKAKEHFEYKFLKIIVPKKHYNSGTPTGTHASPRTHLRRGHIRRFTNGTYTWVQSTLVNPGHGGIDKEYMVKTK